MNLNSNVKERKIQGTNIQYNLTRSFIEATNAILGGKGANAAMMVANSLGENEVIRNAERGKTFSIKLEGLLNIIGKKVDYNEVVFITMKKNY